MKPCPFCGWDKPALVQPENVELYYVTCDGCGCGCSDANTEAEAIAAWNTRSDGWIRVEDRLPEEIIEFVLVARNWGVKTAMEANYVDGKFMTYRFGTPSEFVDPTHWQPLPEPPKEDE